MLSDGIMNDDSIERNSWLNLIEIPMFLLKPHTTRAALKQKRYSRPRQSARGRDAKNRRAVLVRDPHLEWHVCSSFP